MRILKLGERVVITFNDVSSFDALNQRLHHYQSQLLFDEKIQHDHELNFLIGEWTKNNKLLNDYYVEFEVVERKHSIKTVEFRKEKGNWFFDLPDWSGDKSELYMSDINSGEFLNKLSRHSNHIKLYFSCGGFESQEGMLIYDKNKLQSLDGFYYDNNHVLGPSSICLPEVFKLVFFENDGFMPEKIYFGRHNFFRSLHFGIGNT